VTQSTATDAELIARAIALQPLVRAASDEADRERRLPARVAEALGRAGLYRVSAPRSYQGAEASPATQIKVIEAISYADAAAGWNLMIGIESFGLLSRGFPLGSELFADPLAILSSSTAAFGRAEAVQGGYRVSGDWQFVSGCHNCDWFAGLLFIHENGTPIAGRLPHFALIPRDEIEILDTWNVAGLRGSGSHDVQVRDALVPEERLVSFGAPADPSLDTPLSHIPVGSRLAYNKVGVGVGIGRAAIDGALEGRRPTDRERALLQIACSDAARASADAVDWVAEAAGTTANRLDSPLERYARDVRVIRQHVTVAPQHLDDAGRVLLGLPPEGLMLSMAG
jgi:alkylation response protein AidB-like acyl-CoA dehydrogenase